MRFPTFRRPLPPDPIGPDLGPPTAIPADLTGQTVVLTGGGGGMARPVAQTLSSQGARVVLVDVDEASVRALASDIERDGGEAEVIIGDQSTSEGTRAIAQQLLERCPRIDVMINNAGTFRSTFDTNDAGHELTIAVNHLSSFLLTQLLLDRLTESDARILFVSSDAHRQAKPIDWNDVNCERAWKKKTVDSSAGFFVYNQSKLMLTATAMELAERTEGTGVTINVLTPGALVKTGMYDDVHGWFAGLIAVFTPVLRTVDKSSWTYVYLASSPEVEGVTGWYWHDVRPQRESKVAQDRELREQIWTWSSDAVGLA